MRLRSALRSVVECCGALARYMEEQGPRKAMDVDELLLRESMDVIGQALLPLLTLMAPFEGFSCITAHLRDYQTPQHF